MQLIEATDRRGRGNRARWRELSSDEEARRGPICVSSRTRHTYLLAEVAGLRAQTDSYERNGAALSS